MANSLGTKTLTEEIALDLLTQPRAIPDFAKKFYGEENIEELQTIFLGNAVVDLEKMILTGEITPEELSQYGSLTGELAETKEKLRTLAQKIAQDLFRKGKLNFYVEKTFNKDGSVNTKNPGLKTLVEGIDKLCTSLSLKNTLSFTNSCATDFQSYLIEFVAFYFTFLFYKKILIESTQTQEKAIQDLNEILGNFKTGSGKKTHLKPTKIILCRKLP